MAEAGLAATNEIREEARRYVRRKRILFTVVGAWLALCLLWFAIDMLDGSEALWFYWPMLGTGIGVAVTAVGLLGMGGLFGVEWERREIERYVRRIDLGPAPAPDLEGESTLRAEADPLRPGRPDAQTLPSSAASGLGSRPPSA
ncbi:MAG TPA: 2TM domain-containing protein [Gaiellaceae bacterium]|nr:2TM domain-containing protein [Gaiellaceae bacterium]